MMNKWRKGRRKNALRTFYGLKSVSKAAFFLYCERGKSALKRLSLSSSLALVIGRALPFPEGNIREGEEKRREEGRLRFLIFGNRFPFGAVGVPFLLSLATIPTTRANLA